MPDAPSRRLSQAIEALRAAGHTVEPAPDRADLWRVDGRDPISDGMVLAMAIRLGLMDRADPPR